MEGLSSELRRLGMATSGANRMMAKADREEPKARPAPIASVTVITGDVRSEAAVQKALAVIATAFRKGVITETQAQMLVSRLPAMVRR